MTERPTPPGQPHPPQPQGYPPPAQTPGTAIAALVLGILGITMCGCFPLGIVAWVMGKKAELQIRESQGRLTGEGLAKAGWITGIIGTVGGALYLVGIIVFVILSFMADPQSF